MSTLFISDLHLDPKRPEIISLFCRFLKERAVRADALYILGDLFEFWIGDDDKQEWQNPIIEELKSVTSAGIPVYLIHGNRDFLLGRRFCKATGIKLIPDPSVIELYGKKVLLMHGDTLCTDDTAYLKFRKKARNPILQLFFLLRSLKGRRAYANRARTASAAHKKITNKIIMDVTPSEVFRVLNKYKTPYLIHGHTHRPGFHTIDLPDGQAQRIVLGAWESNGNVLEFSASAPPELQAIPL